MTEQTEFPSPVNGRGKKKPSPACGRGQGEGALSANAVLVDERAVPLTPSPSPVNGRGEGAMVSQAKLALNKREQMVAAHRNFRRHAHNAPAERRKLSLAFFVAQFGGCEMMDAAVDFNNQLRLYDGKVGYEASDRMLAPYDDAEFSQLPKRVPRDRFGCVGALAQSPRLPDFLAVSHRVAPLWNIVHDNRRAIPLTWRCAPPSPACGRGQGEGVLSSNAAFAADREGPLPPSPSLVNGRGEEAQP